MVKHGETIWNKIIRRTKSHCTAGWYFFWVAIGYPASWNFLKGASTHGIAMAVSVILKPTLERSWEHCFHSEATKNWGWCLWCVFTCDVPTQKPQILSFARKDFGDLLFSLSLSPSRYLHGSEVWSLVDLFGANNLGTGQAPTAAESSKGAMEPARLMQPCSTHRLPKKSLQLCTGWCPPVISGFINPINYSYICHKP